MNHMVQMKRKGKELRERVGGGRGGLVRRLEVREWQRRVCVCPCFYL